jgi:hypothetical protein
MFLQMAMIEGLRRSRKCIKIFPTLVGVAVSEHMLGLPEWIPLTTVSDRFFYAFWSAHSDLFYTLS